MLLKHLLPLAALAASTAAITLPATPAEAQVRRGKVVSVQTPYRGYVRGSRVERGPGYRSVDRGVRTRSGRGAYSSTDASWGPGYYNRDTTRQTRSGYGHSVSRDANWGDGRYQGGRTVTTNAGNSFGRSTVVTGNGDGTANYDYNRTRRDGSTVSHSGTVGPRP
ncbi:hypothetical protein [Sphingomonas suaedae]|uniref:hypothetical protein n=1 Tax=Sphingomonas suaedae TaxID=2599297 RepID=UPI001EF082E3|nr:hypothetical protein [Sphingomonas suaedae]